MLTQELIDQTVLLAQVDDSEAIAPEVPPSISLSDTTPLGPYSVLLKDAFEESQSEQGLILNASNEATPDIVAIARSLTPKEKLQGLSQQLITREKIALIVDADNPFQGTLTLAQVAGIFRGEITNWSQLGGSDRPLKLFHRSVNHPTRLSLATYDLNTGSDDPRLEQDTTAVAVEQLGIEGISYAPASETIEQFNTRVLTIDNVGVDDGRYPLSQPLYYVFQSPPQAEVQDFLAFLESPDAQAAVEFAQSQPADPTRPLSQPDLSALTGQAVEEPALPSDEAIAPNQPPEGSTSVSETPGEISTPTVPEPTSTDGVGSWLPLLLLFASLGLLSWLAYMRASLEAKRKKTPRPAPDYAARINAQGSNRHIDELRAIAEGPAKAKAAASAPRLETPDLSLDGAVPQWDESPEKSMDNNPTSTALDEASISQDDAREKSPDETDDVFEDLFDEDVTVLQAVPSDLPDLMSETDVDESPTTLQFVSAMDAPAETAEVPDLDADEVEDATVLQGVFAPDPSAAHLDDKPEESAETQQVQSEDDSEEPHRDPLTGQLTDELDALSELEAADEQRSQEKAAQQLESRSSRTEDASDHWEEVADPWD